MLAALTLLAPVRAAAQQLPRLQEENLAGQQVVLPDTAAGKAAVLVFGFSRASQNSTGAWMKHLREDFGKNAGVVLYQLPVLEEAPRMMRGMITSGMKNGVPEAERANFVPVMHNEAELKTLDGTRNLTTPTVVLEPYRQPRSRRTVGPASGWLRLAHGATKTR